MRKRLLAIQLKQICLWQIQYIFYQPHHIDVKGMYVFILNIQKNLSKMKLCYFIYIVVKSIWTATVSVSRHHSTIANKKSDLLSLL